jgi:hypothetical protein
MFEMFPCCTFNFSLSTICLQQQLLNLACTDSAHPMAASMQTICMRLLTKWDVSVFFG